MKLLATILLAALAFGQSGCLLGGAIYQYVGNPFDDFEDNRVVPGEYDRTHRVTVTIILAAPLGPGFSGKLPGLMSYSFGDGRNTLDSSNSDPSGAQTATTDDGGNIVTWTLEVSEPSGPESGVIKTTSEGGGTDEGAILAIGLVADVGRIEGSPGGWTRIR